MFPYINDFFKKNDISNYFIALIFAILAAFICFRIISTRAKINASAYNFYLVAFLLSLIVGFFSAFLFQAIYNYFETGKFKLVGMTVMGGILGAVLFFLLFVAVMGKTKLGSRHRSLFWTVTNLAIPCLVIAQCIGRLGCFLGGCCYGKETDSFLGVTFVEKILLNGEYIMFEKPRFPTQLFESIFMLMLFLSMLFVMFKFKKWDKNVLIYLYSYSVFRFFIEFLRDDPRGAFLLGLSPSQCISILLFLLAVTLTILINRLKIIPFLDKSQISQQQDKE